jgi:hypothetical protein
LQSYFVAKFGGKPCARCRAAVQVGQLVRFTGSGKALEHVGVCPIPAESTVVFRHWCGCKVGSCSHGQDAVLRQIEAELQEKLAAKRKN